MIAEPAARAAAGAGDALFTAGLDAILYAAG
jgi:hypothetical protein